jgi:hypothetical protein
MIVEISSGKGGFKLYLEHGQKKGREQHRDQLDQRIALAGDLDVFEVATLSVEGAGYKYDHITFSFAEDHVSDEILQLAVDEFREHALAAWPQADRNRIAFYAEAHRPRMTSYTNSETGLKVVRLTHIHIGFGKHDLLTGKAIAPLGFLGPQSDNLKYIDAWQESFNSRHGLSSPKDNPKIAPQDAVDMLARYTGHRPDALGSFNEQKAAFELVLQKEIIAKNVTTWDGFGQLLSAHGELSKVRAGQFNECYRIKPSGASRAMRLQGVFFQRQFIERSTDEKLEIISRKAKTAYLEQMQPRKATEYLAKTLTEWHTSKARELRYLHTGSAFYKEVYQPADAATRLHLLNEIEREHHDLKSSVAAQNRQIATARNRVPRMPARNLDGIQSRTKILLSDHPGVDVRAASAAESNRDGLRQTNRGGRGRGGNDAVSQSDISTAGLHAGQTAIDGHRGGEIQPSSVLARLQVELSERYEQAADKDRYAEIRQHLDCSQLLARLSHTHGLDVELYQVTTAKDGTPRIQCGSRALSPSDFLSKQLGLPWKEAAPILRQVYEHQLGKKVTPACRMEAPSQLWTAFKAEQLALKPVVVQRLQAFDAETTTRRSALFATLKIEQANALAGLTGATRKAELSLGKLNMVTAKAEFTAERRELRKTIHPIQATAWRLFLQARAQAGSEEALAILRKLDDTARTVPDQAICGIILLDDSEDEKKRRRRAAKSVAVILKTLVHVVEINGDITYSQYGRAVLRDEGTSIAVLDQESEEAIAAALLLAREKFGINLRLTGSPEFQRRVVAVAVEQGIAVRFIDPQLDAIRQQMVDVKRHVVRTPSLIEKGAETAVLADVAYVATLNESVQQTGDASMAVLDMQSGDSHEMVPEPPHPQTAAEWIATTAEKPAAQPYRTGSTKAMHAVVHVAHDGIVIDHGRSVAIYPVPSGLTLEVGDKVVVGKAQSLSLPHLPEQVSGKNVPSR